MILKRSADAEYASYARTVGLAELKKDGIAKAIAGLTTLSEIYRVTG
jgi:type IV pilus assembly protein PilB